MSGIVVVNIGLDDSDGEGHPVGTVRRTIEGDAAYKSAGRSAHIQPDKPCVICRWWCSLGVGASNNLFV